jgi:hypothetical protein
MQTTPDPQENWAATPQPPPLPGKTSVLEDAYQEALDLVMYLRAELEKKRKG